MGSKCREIKWGTVLLCIAIMFVGMYFVYAKHVRDQQSVWRRIELLEVRQSDHKTALEVHAGYITRLDKHAKNVTKALKAPPK